MPQNTRDNAHENPPAGHIRADRACVSCGFNLYGQPVTKEPHYGLAIARCPECGTAAALQQYPTATHLVSRYHAVLSAFWIAILLLMAVINVWDLRTMVDHASREAGAELASTIAVDFDAWSQQQQSQGSTSSFSVYQIDPTWIRDHLDATIRDAGGLWANLSPNAVYALMTASLAAVFWGVWWSIALLGSSRRRVMIASMGIVLAATLLELAPSTNQSNWRGNNPRFIAGERYMPVMLPAVMGVVTIGIVLGIWIGRPLARWLIVAALPPRSRVPFGVFWTRDGLDPPPASRA